MPLQRRNQIWQSLQEGAGKRCLEFGGRCRKSMLAVWRKVPEIDARSLEEGAGKRCFECDSQSCSPTVIMTSEHRDQGRVDSCVFLFVFLLGGGGGRKVGGRSISKSESRLTVMGTRSFCSFCKLDLVRFSRELSLLKEREREKTPRIAFRHLPSTGCKPVLGVKASERACLCMRVATNTSTASTIHLFLGE